MTRCFATVDVKSIAGQRAGGLIGWNHTGSAVVSNCYATGDVQGYDRRNGRLVNRETTDI